MKPKFIISGKPFIQSVNEALNIGAESSSALHPRPTILEIKQIFQDAVARGSHSDPATYQPVHTADPKTQPLCGSFSSGTSGKQKAVILNGHVLLRSVIVSRWVLNQNGNVPTYLQSSECL